MKENEIIHDDFLGDLRRLSEEIDKEKEKEKDDEKHPE